MQIKVDILENKVDILENKVDILENEVHAIKNVIFRMEIEHGKKMDALFDGYKQMYDISKEIRKDITEMQVLQEKQELSIKWLNSMRKAE